LMAAGLKYIAVDEELQTRSGPAKRLNRRRRIVPVRTNRATRLVWPLLETAASWRW
jgi:hypothetical protein